MTDYKFGAGFEKDSNKDEIHKIINEVNISGSKLPSVFYKKREDSLQERVDENSNSSASDAAEKYKRNYGIAKTVATILCTAYIVGTGVKTHELSKAIEPLKTEFRITAQKTEPSHYIIMDGGEWTRTNYGGKFKKFLESKKEFAKDNGAFPLAWKIYNSGKDKIIDTPTPVAWNPKYWNKKIDVSAIKDYQKNNNYRMK